MCVECVNCGKELNEPTDTTVSNVENERCFVGQHTGDIYYCEKCDSHTLDDFLNRAVVSWHY